ncbi:MAG: DUF3341 domain-containing protein [Acidobacteriota bacterium]|nr:DUF3341 domain-containing protein [Blastocatellia bacterium]MDW8238857.1 DUF3341 domain-containing protein [Acidobacteriota bacterium]
MKPTGALGIFSHLDTAVRAVQQLRRQGFHHLVVHAPVPRHELLEALEHTSSSVGIWTLCGSVIGFVGGFAVAVWTSLDWPMMTGGKPIISVPAFIVIAFELAILFGGLATLLGFFVNARLPRSMKNVVYDPRFSEDHFGIFIGCRAEDVDAAHAALQAVGAKEVRVENS